jgi:hypothetical protein
MAPLEIPGGVGLFVVDNPPQSFRLSPLPARDYLHPFEGAACHPELATGPEGYALVLRKVKRKAEALEGEARGRHCWQQSGSESPNGVSRHFPRGDG